MSVLFFNMLCVLVIVVLARKIWSAECAIRAYKDRKRAGNALDTWRKARPFLYVGQCKYAQSLVLAMIAAQRRINKYDDCLTEELKEMLLATLYRLLNEQPPRDNPPKALPQQAPGFLLLD